jgi:hypothetical protein
MFIFEHLNSPDTIVQRRFWPSAWQTTICPVLSYVTITCVTGLLVFSCYNSRFDSIHHTVSLFICFHIQFRPHVPMHSHTLFALYNRQYFTTASNILLSHPHIMCSLRPMFEADEGRPTFSDTFTIQYCVLMSSKLLQSRREPVSLLTYSTARETYFIYIYICMWYNRQPRESRAWNTSE